MALFGKKAKDAPSATPLADDDAASGASGGPATLTADAPGTEASGTDAEAPLGKPVKTKAVREPKTPKSRAVKSGVAVGLNIGNQFIKAVEVSSKGGELSVTAMGFVPTPPESYSNGNVLSVSALANAVKDLWRTAGIKSKVAITSVAGTGALVVRVIEVPRMSDGELRDNMRVDADRYIPFPPSEVVMDFKALRELPTDPDAPNMEVLLAAAQREIIDLHVSVVQKARLSPRAIDVEPIAATRALQLERSSGLTFADYNEVTAVVNIGASGAEISILRGDVLVFTRTVPNGGNAVTQAIADGMGLPFSDAERVKIDSADALAPAGYDPNAGFGFGGGDDFDFGAPAGAADFGTPAAASAADPFDLDVFNQDLPQSEPGAGHAQKEGGTPDDSNSPFSFDFDLPDTPAQPTSPGDAASTSNAAPDADSSGGSAFDFAFPADDAPAPSTPAPSAPAPSAPAPSAPAPSAPAPFGFDDDATDATPLSLDKGTRALSDEPAPSFEDDAFSDDVFSSPAASAADVTTPDPVAPDPVASAQVASAFDFDNFDLPAVQPGAPVVPAPAAAPAPAAPDPFSFDTPPAVASTPVVDSPPVADTTAIPAGDFDLDDVFGSPATATTPTTSTADLMDDLNVGSAAAVVPPTGTPAALGASAGDFDLSGIDTGFGDDFGLGAAPASDDFAAFGAGLSPSGGTTDAATLYSLIYGPLEELSNEVRRSLEFHLGRYPDATISRLVLMGGGARLKNLDVFLTQMLGVPTVVANPFAHLTVRSAKLSPEYATENGPICAVALGLALRDFVD